MHKLHVFYAATFAVTIAISSMADVGFGPCCGGNNKYQPAEQPTEEPIKDSRLRKASPTKLAVYQVRSCPQTPYQSYATPLCQPR